MDVDIRASAFRDGWLDGLKEYSLVDDLIYYTPYLDSEYMIAYGEGYQASIEAAENEHRLREDC